MTIVQKGIANFAVLLLFKNMTVSVEPFLSRTKIMSKNIDHYSQKVWLGKIFLPGISCEKTYLYGMHVYPTIPNAESAIHSGIWVSY